PHRTPTATLLPYTTLFRSPLAAAPGIGLGILLPAAWRLRSRRLLLDFTLRDRSLRRRRHSPLVGRTGSLDGNLLLTGSDLTGSGDRKSTRLNSSHVAISYA